MINEGKKLSFNKFLFEFDSICTIVCQTDQKVLDESINDIRDQLKVKVNDLRRLEGKPELKGYNLTPLNSKELEAIKNIVPEVVNSDI